MSTSFQTVQTSTWSGRADDGEESMEVDDLSSLDGSNGEWACRRCTLFNPSTTDRCELCEAPQKNNVPTTLPKNLAKSGEQIGGKDPIPPSVLIPENSTPTQHRRDKPVPDKSTNLNQKRIANGSAEEEWTCRICTFNNNPMWASICETCSSVRQTYNSNQDSTPTRDPTQKTYENTVKPPENNVVMFQV